MRKSVIAAFAGVLLATTAHAEMAALMADPGFAERALLRAMGRWEDARATHRPSPFLLEFLRVLGRKAFDLVGVFPPSPVFWLRYGRKGALLRDLRRRRGLPPHSRI